MRRSVLGVCSDKGNSMALTVLMFFVLAASFVLMFGLVKFAENVIAKTQSRQAGENATARSGDTQNLL
jgi:hypothetical protein